MWNDYRVMRMVMRVVRTRSIIACYTYPRIRTLINANIKRNTLKVIGNSQLCNKRTEAEASC